MEILDPIAGVGFTLADLSNAINNLPSTYGRIRLSGLFVDQKVTSRQVLIEEQTGTLSLIPLQPYGSPGALDRPATRKIRNVIMQQAVVNSELLPEEYVGVRPFGAVAGQDAINAIINSKLQKLRAQHDITLEYLMAGALNGKVLDVDGVTVKYDFFSLFEVTEKSVDFLLGTSTTDIEKKCREVIRHIEQNLKGEVMTGVKAYVGEDFFDKLVSHPKVRETYINWAAAEALRNGMAVGQDNTRAFVRQFPYGGILFEEYPGFATDAAGNTRRFFPVDGGRAFPLGTMDTFRLLIAPGDFNEVNKDDPETIQPVYVKMEPREFGRGWKIHTQANRLPICYRPATLVKITTSN